MESNLAAIDLYLSYIGATVASAGWLCPGANFKTSDHETILRFCLASADYLEISFPCPVLKDYFPSPICVN